MVNFGSVSEKVTFYLIEIHDKCSFITLIEVHPDSQVLKINLNEENYVGLDMSMVYLAIDLCVEEIGAVHC